MRTFLLAATLAAFSASAQTQPVYSTPEASGGSVLLSVPDALPSVSASPDLAPEAERRNVVSGVFGGEGFSVGVGYERALAGSLFARTGLQYYSNGIDIRGSFVPVAVGVRKELGRRWAVDGSAGATVAFMHAEEDAIPQFEVEAETRDYVVVVPNLGLGVRYETGRVSLRGGAALFPRRYNRIAGEPARWSVLPWPSMSAGYRF